MKMEPLSPRLAALVEALPLRPGMRVLEIGCGPGAAAREIAKRIGSGFVLAIDRSPKAIQQAIKGSQTLIASGRLQFREAAAESLVLAQHEPRFDLAFAVRVGALDGRYPHRGELALAQIAKALHAHGRLFIDGGNPIKEIPLEKYR